MMIFVSVARDQSSLGAVVVIFLAVMAVNILCMLFATWILRCIGLTAMSALAGCSASCKQRIVFFGGIAYAFGLRRSPNL